MTATQSKQRQGLLTLDPAVGDLLEVGVQARHVKITPKTKNGDEPVELLSGEFLADDATTTYTLAVKSIQDFTNPNGVQAFAWNHDGETMPFTWKPAGAAGPTYAGNLTVRSIEVGGDVGKRLEVDVEWECTAKPVLTYPAG